MIRLLPFSVALTLFGCGSPQQDAQTTVDASSTPKGQYRGYYAVERHIQSTVLDAAVARDFRLSRYVADDHDSIYPLMGAYQSENGTTTFINGDPNNMNFVIWHVAISSLARDVSRLCRTQIGTGLSQEIKDILLHLCQWPENYARDEVWLQRLWLQVMGYRAPESEMQSFVSYFLSEDMPYYQSDAEEVIEAMMVAIMLNPYYLLER